MRLNEYKILILLKSLSRNWMPQYPDLIVNLYLLLVCFCFLLWRKLPIIHSFFLYRETVVDYSTEKFKHSAERADTDRDSSQDYRKGRES